MKHVIELLFCVGLVGGFVASGYSQANEECFECHSGPELTTEDDQGNVRSLLVVDSVYTQSVHGELDCIDCHADVSELPHDEKLEKVDCGTCHEDATEAVDSGVHGTEFGERSPDSPTCSQCHGMHDIFSPDDPRSLVNKLNQPKTCAKCHADMAIVKRNNIPFFDPVSHYEKSIHGQLTLSGNLDAATCSDCHGAHDIHSAYSAKSKVYKTNVPKTCSQCHEKEYEDYRISVHAKALTKGAADAPVCTDCHGEHNILNPKNPKAPTYKTHMAKEVCSPCHASERLAGRYGFSTGRVTSYEDSYHGLAIRGGKASVANCGSCRGVHDVLPSSDPRSRIYLANIAKTCGQCHPKASENFAKGPVHLLAGGEDFQIVYFIRSFYIALIVATIGFMLLHNSLDWIAKIREIRAERRNA